MSQLACELWLVNLVGRISLYSPLNWKVYFNWNLLPVIELRDKINILLPLFLSKYCICYRTWCLFCSVNNIQFEAELALKKSIYMDSNKRASLSLMWQVNRFAGSSLMSWHIISSPFLTFVPRLFKAASRNVSRSSKSSTSSSSSSSSMLLTILLLGYNSKKTSKSVQRFYISLTLQLSSTRV